MRAYLLRRLLLIPVTLLGVTLIVFALTRILPGGPYEQALQRAAAGEGSRSRLSSGSGGSSLTPDQKEQLRMQFSMNDHFLNGYLKWLGLLPREVNARFVPLSEDNATPMVLLGDIAPDGRAFSKKALILDFSDPSRPPRLELPPPESAPPAGWSVRFGLDEKTGPDGRTAFVPDPSRIVAFRQKRSGLLQGDFQESLSSGEPVASLISRRLPVSLFYGLLTTFLTYLIAIPLGVVKAIRHRTFLDNASSVALFIGYAIPGFALGTLLLLWFSFRFDWFPMSGFTSADFSSLSLPGKIRDLLHHAALPLVCYMIGSWTLYAFLMKNSLMDVLATDYVRTAVSKGVSFSQAVTRHALRNAIIPIASTFGQNVSLILSGSVLIENVFDIPGIGQLGFESALHRDYTTMMALITLSSALLMLGNLISDLLIAALNPRIRFD